MPDPQTSERRAQEWGTIGTVLFGVGVTGVGALLPAGYGEHLWENSFFLTGLAFSCLLGGLGTYALAGAFVWRLPLPATLREREEKQRPAPPRPVRRSAPVQIVFGFDARRTAPKRRAPKRRKPPDLEKKKEEELFRRVKDIGREHEAHARRQLVATIKSGMVLREAGVADGPLGLDWREEAKAMVKESAGEHRASTLTQSDEIEHWLTCLREIKRHPPVILKVSESWDAYAERMRAFLKRLQPVVIEGMHLRVELSEGLLDAEQGASRVAAWERDVDEAFSDEAMLGEALRDGLPTAAKPVFEGLTDEEIANALHQDALIRRLRALLPIVAHCVEAMSGK
ncbi:MAG: hypothetical protein ABSB69_19485 [Solirubrobacteraceae bacterium]